MPPNEGYDFSLVPAVGIGVEQTHRESLDLMASNGTREEFMDALELERLDLRAIVPKTARNLEAQVPSDDRLGETDRQIEEVVTALLSDLQKVAEAPRNEHRCLYPFSLDNCVGDERRAVHDQVEGGKAQPCRFGQSKCALHYSLGRVIWCC